MILLHCILDDGLLIIACDLCRFTDEDRLQLLQGKLESSRPKTVAAYRSHVRKFEVLSKICHLFWLVLDDFIDENESCRSACYALHIASCIRISTKSYDAFVGYLAVLAAFET